MKKIIIVLAVMLFGHTTPAIAGDTKFFGFTFGFGKTGAPCQQCNGAKPETKPGTIHRQKAPLIRPQKVAYRTSQKSEPEPKKEKYIERAEKLVKVSSNHRNWGILSAESMGAFGVTYGARKQNWVIGSIGASLLLYEVFSKRNENSFEEQVLAVAIGAGAGYLPKISSDKDDATVNNPAIIPLPPPPAP